ncbi:RE1 [Symbiodinium sp. CCMP2592]|nr:RE1 [Symbiodinium sp. CCMP2592]
MAVEGDGGSTAAGSAAGVSHLPWQQIPKFVPGTTNLDDYTQRLKFLKELWPADSIQHLGPRAALQVEGSAFQKISRIAPDKLRSQEGVQLIVEALGGAWGKTAVEEKFHFFEQAIFQVTQKNDETNDSYLARSDAYFEELLTRKVTIEEIRAYVLLRHSQLAPEDKKRVVIESKGDLKYKETVKAIRLLGSKIFGDLQNKNATGNRGLERNKIYDVHYTEENGAEDVYYSAVPEEEPSDEDLLCYFMDLNDEDAVYITEFEESIVDAIQDSELAPVYVTYQEARQRLRDKAKARGYWPAKGRGKTKGFGKKGKGSSSSSFPGWGTGRNRSLADRIANSTCRICHQKGHWKRECPRRLAQDGNEAKVEVTHFTQETSDTFAQNLPEILHAMPPESEPYIGEEDALKLQGKMATPDVDEPLVAPESGAIALDRPSLESYLDVEFVRPKGVETLRAWGDMTLTAGKHKTKTFAAAFGEDLVYAVTMARKQSLTSSWAISFKNYCLARLKAAARAEQMEDQKRQGKGTRKAAFPNRSQNTATLEDEEAAFANRSRNTATFKDEEEFGEWKLCLNEGRATGSSASTAENHKGKRANAQDPNPAMSTDLTAEQRLDIMTRKALLQRELAQLEQLDPSWDEKIEDKLGKLDSETEDFRKKMHYKLPRLDVLEITLADSGISNAIRNRQGRAVSIKTWDASRIWFMIHMYEPKHLWMNGGRQDPSKVFWPKELLYDLYEHQIEHGRHFHLCTGQNIFAESSPELQDVMHGTMCAVHCPSEAMGLGKMRGNNFLNKKSFIYTTSRVVHEAIDTRKEPTHLSNPSQATSNTSAPRSPTWQLRLAEQAAAAMISDRSVPLYLSELLVADLKREGDLNLSNRAALENVQQVVKRRRLLRKQPAPEMCKARDQFKDASWIAIFKKFDVPHRGRVYFRDGDEVVKQVQTLIPQFQIKHVVMARGTNRVQLPKPGLEIQDIPLRQTIVVSRDNGKVMADGGCEQWTKPAAIHLDADFGDVLGMDVAYWSGQSGHKYMFTHILDEATLFHQATATGRTMEDQYEVLTDSWNKWAGPCQLLYVVGRVEAHGKILKAMLSRMDAGDLPTREDVEMEGVAPASEPPPVAGASPPAVGEVEGGVGEIDTGGGFEIPVDSGETPPSAVGAEQPETEVSPAVSMEQEHEEPMEVDPVEVPVPEDEDDLLFGDSECFLIHPSSEQVWEIGLHETDVDYKDLPSPEQALNFVMLASTERKKRTEVRLRDLNQHERQLFKEAQNKEIKAWLDHRTVRRVAAGTLEDSQLMRCRWILTWKAPEKEGGPHRAKARLVVLGFEDPGLSDIPNDAPTLGKDGRQLILQQVASRQWKLINFDISTAFLQGKGDGRKLGIKPPEELREALGMGPTDQCRLEGGAYGRIDAPFLWFQTLKQTLEELGFIQSPFDPCTFSLVTKGPGGEPRVHGVLGIHVDDGIGGGDAYFSRVIEQLRGIYSFGSYDEGEFVFTGIRFRQWDDGSIEMDQTAYLEKIMPIHANKVLHEAKSHAVSLMVVPIPEKHLTFCTFSDASFASSKDNHSYQGTLVIATDWRMLQNQRAVIVPVAWASKKISRVVRSTLSAEVVALCGSLDRMSWLRLFWEWIKNPGIDISHPEEVLKEAPKASLVTDCKSAYDVHQSKILADIRLNSDRGGRAEVRLSCQKEQGSAEGATV